MGLFGMDNKKQPRKYKVRTPDEEERRAKRKNRKVIDGYFYELAKDNPEWKKRLVAKELGIEVPDSRPVTDGNTEMQALLTSEALNVIKNDPDLRSDLARQKVESILGIKPRRRHDNGDEGIEIEPDDESSFSRVARELDEADALKERLGVKSNGGGFAGLIDADVVKAIINYFTVQKRIDAGIKVETMRTYVIQVDGEMKEVTEDQYKVMIQQGKLQPVAQLSTAKPEPKTTEIESPITPVTEPMFDQTLVDSVGKLLDLTPQEFADKIKTEGLPGVDKDTVNVFLKSSTYESISALVTPYKSDPQVGKYVMKIIENKEWVNKVLELLNNTSQESESESQL